jgi:alkaline phosphatase
MGLPELAWSASQARFKPGDKPRNIIHLVSDGTSWGTITLSDHLKRKLSQSGLAWLELYKHPDVARAFMDMRSLNSLVTDSAAASTSWGSGSRVKNGVLNMLPDGVKLKTLCQLFGELGWARGLVTTTEITHATPAGFSVNLPSRGDANSIAVQYLDQKIEVLLGGGRQYFDPAKRKDKWDLAARFQQEQYAVFNTAREFDRAAEDRSWLGLFASGHLPYSLDRKNSAKDLAEIPSLAQMTRRALGKLGRSPHFLLQVEGGRVDHAAHACDAAAAGWDMIAFDEALEVCLDYQRKDPETLIIVTTDHGTGGPGLSGADEDYGTNSKVIANLASTKCSIATMLSQIGKNTDLVKISRIIRDATGYAPNDAKTAVLSAFLAKKQSSLFSGLNSASAQLGQILGNHNGIGWVSGGHTSDYVPLMALGPGAELFQGFIKNTDVFSHYTNLTGIDYRNPKAKLGALSGPSAAEVEALDEYVVA